MTSAPIAMCLLRVVSLATALAASAAAAGAQTVLNFEAVPAAGAAGAFANAGGYTFANFATLDAGSAFGVGTNASSGSRFAYVLLQGGPDPRFGSVRREDVNFDLLEAFLSFRRFDANADPVTITVNAYRGFDPAASPVFTQTVTLTNSAQRVAFDFRNVSEVEFLTDPLQAGGRQAVLAVDDLALATVPEPATVVLVGLGGAAAVVVAHRRRA